MAHLGLRQPVPVGTRKEVAGTAGSTGSARQIDQQRATLEDAREALGDSFVWRSVKFRVVGGVLQWQMHQGEWIPVDSPPSGDYQRCTQRGSMGVKHNRVYKEQGMRTQGKIHTSGTVPFFFY